jgi:hypothetical protein
VPTLKIDLQDGFAGDRVIMRIDGAVVYDRAGIKTRMQVGLADSAEVEAGPAAELRVELPEKGIDGSTTVNAEKTPNIGVSVEGGSVAFKYPREGQVMFGYV